MRNGWTPAAAVVCGLTLSACMVDNQREVDTYRAVLGATPPAATQAYRPDAPLPLTRALALAVAGDERLAIAGESYLQALIDKDRAAAAFLPSIAFTPSYLRERATGLAPGNPLVAEFVPARALDAPVTGAMQFNVARDWTKIQQSARTAEERRELLLDLKAAVLLDVARTYYGVLEAEQRVAVLTHALGVQQQRVKDIAAKVEAGALRRLDLLQSQAQASATHVQLLAAQVAARTGRKTLAFLVGVPAVEGTLRDDLTVPEAGDEAAWLDLALTRRADLRAAADAVEAAAQGLQAAWSEYFPTVSLNAAGYLSRQSFPDDVNWTSMVQVYMPIFTAGLIHADVRTAYSQWRQAQLQQARLGRQVGKDLRVALDELKSSREQAAELRVLVAAAQKADEDAANAFSAGAATNLERLTAQDRLLTAQLQLATEEMNGKVDYLSLQRVAGVLDERAPAAVPFGPVPATAPAAIEGKP